MMKRILLFAALLALVLPAFVQAQVTPSCGCMDLVFIVDDTGSMGPSIANIKTGLATILATADAASGGDLRAGVVSFKDNVEVDLGFTADEAAVTAAINALVASGGLGEPEASDEALKYVATGATSCALVGAPPLGDFRSECVNIAVLITDARPGGCDDTYADGVDDVATQAAADAAAAAGIFVSTVHVLDGANEATSTAILTAVAATTGGQYVEVPVTGEGVSDAINDIIAACGTAANECPNSQGFWKNHEDAWPVEELTIGGTLYTAEELLAVLNAPTRGNAVLILAKQYIAALLNIANGSSPVPIAAELAAADALLTGVDITEDAIRTNTATGHDMTSVASTLDDYNNRYLTPDCEESGGEDPQ